MVARRHQRERHQQFSLAALWADVARIAGEVPPVAVQTIVGDILDQQIVPLPIPTTEYADYTRVALPAD